MEEKSPEVIEAEMNFYEAIDSLHLSPSSLKLLIEAPKAWHKKYVLKQEEIKSALHFDEGSLLHAMILEPDTLDDNFINMGVNAPGDTAQAIMKSLLSLGRSAVELEEYSEEILEYLKEVNLYQSFVDDKRNNKEGKMLTGDEKRLNKVINETSKEYFKLLCEARNKTIVDAISWDKCLRKKEAVLSNEKAAFLLQPTHKALEEFATELELRHAPTFLKYKIKGILDAIKVDFEEKKIYVTDFKTTGGSLEVFKESFEKYGYWLQASIYYWLAESLKRNAAAKFEIEVNFVVIDRMDHVYVFPVSEETLKISIERAKEMINTKIDYHIQNKDFNLPYEFANNLVSL